MIALVLAAALVRIEPSPSCSPIHIGGRVVSLGVITIGAGYMCHGRPLTCGDVLAAVKGVPGEIWLDGKLCARFATCYSYKKPKCIERTIVDGENNTVTGNMGSYSVRGNNNTVKDNVIIP